jgi:hypothetical protein
MAAMQASIPQGSTSSKKASIRAAGPDRQPDPLRTLGAVALVRSFIAVNVNARVHVATGELDAHEAPSRRWRFATAFVAFGRVIRQIKMFAKHCRYTAYARVFLLRGQCSRQLYRHRCNLKDAKSRWTRTLTGPIVSARFEEAAKAPLTEFASKIAMISRTLLLGLLLLSLTGGGS